MADGMSGTNQSVDDTAETNRNGNRLSRRNVLHGTAVAGALVLGTGTGAANGQGGQAVVYESDFEPDRQFVITEVDDCREGQRNPDGSCWDDPLFFQCDGKGGPSEPGKGGTIPFPYWHFQYVDEDGNLEEEKRQLYTRDNEVRTGVTYRWPGQAKRCPNDLVQTGFTSVRGNE